MPLCERVYHCQNCGPVMDRDLNGSINIENWTKNADSLWVNACGQERAVSLG
ncbi:MAG: zinc ribbon domain-containing protein [Trichodesmium sp. St5_bin2_1]|nr:zinc ribbon domain-containing protein [Trichodesmium sp. St5_bin2_1]MDE5081480.1 zinc ribbon domain-containing protein [Trichodesmium sp. St18_bin1]MDE5116356.1 zinc ribbon domain-containing protein [Trichodesmium sp. St2_bin2_1]